MDLALGQHLPAERRRLERARQARPDADVHDGVGAGGKGCLEGVAKASGLAAAVFGNGASGAVIRAQKSSALSSTPAWNVSSPNETRRGTTVIPSSAARLGDRSLAESMTMATWLMGTPSRA